MKQLPMSMTMALRAEIAIVPLGLIEKSRHLNKQQTKEFYDFTLYTRNSCFFQLSHQHTLKQI